MWEWFAAAEGVVQAAIVTALVPGVGWLVKIAYGALAAAARQRRLERETYRQMQREIHHEVKNSHRTNLRSDLDEMLRQQVRMGGHLATILAGQADQARRVARIDRKLDAHGTILKEHKRSLDEAFQRLSAVEPPDPPVKKK